MARLQALHTDCGQSPWLDNLRREWLASGELAGWIGKGARGLTANPSIFAAAMTQSDAYDEDLARLVAAGTGHTVTRYCALSSTPVRISGVRWFW